MNKMLHQKLSNHDDVLEALAQALDIPDHLFEAAVARYRSVGTFLEREGSSLKCYAPQISPQGSFLLGTVTRPVGDADQYDLDLVCRLIASKRDFSMASLKAAVGKELLAYAQAHAMRHEPEDRRRCWMLEYAEEAKFYMDILPALPDETAYRSMLEAHGYHLLAEHEAVRARAIAITDKMLPNYHRLSDDWPLSNPGGYAVWFRSRQAAELQRRKERLVEDKIYLRVGEVPEHKVKTPLQRAIQLLKRHRDTMFPDDELKPISIIITTLAAHTYKGESSLSEALRTILRDMAQYIVYEGDEARIANPVNPTENFADKWSEEPRRRENFYAWLDRAQRDFGLYISGSAYRSIPQGLSRALSEETVEKVLPLIALAAPAVATKAEAAAAEAKAVQEQGEATKPWAE